MIYSLSADVVENDLPKDTPIWFIVDSEDPETFILTPDIDREWVLWLFMKEGDAEHFAHITQELAPAYRGKVLKATSDPLGEVLDYVTAKEVQLGVLSPNEALKFFAEYEEYLANYYGIHAD